MIPAHDGAAAATAANPKSRLGFIYVPHGAVMDKWTPAAEGAGFEFTPDPEARSNRFASQLDHHHADSPTKPRSRRATAAAIMPAARPLT